MGNPLARFLVLAILSFAAAGVLAGPVLAQEHTVEYRLLKWKSVHFHDAKKAKTLMDTLKGLGCEFKQESDGDCTDVSYRCVQWRMLTLKDHDAVHTWEKWLKSSGFETKHQH